MTVELRKDQITLSFSFSFAFALSFSLALARRPLGAGAEERWQKGGGKHGHETRAMHGGDHSLRLTTCADPDQTALAKAPRAGHAAAMTTPAAHPTTTRRIDGKAAAARVRDEVRVAVAERVGRGLRAPGLATVLVGADPASHVYVRNKRKSAEEVGIHSFHHELPAETTTAALLALVQTLNRDPTVDGILVQLPLPEHVDEHAILVAIAPEKDVDGFHPENVAKLTMGLHGGFVPCTPLGCLRLLDDEGVNLAGAWAVVVGRSNIVGKPMASLLLARHATVTIAHSKTRDLPAITRQADVLVAAVGRARMLGAAHVKPGAIVIDVGINKGDDGKLCGDVDTDAVMGIAAAVTPVPGGVGPMTIAMLLQNTLTSFDRATSAPH